MSKNIIIQQSGFPQALTVDALRTNKHGGGSEDWVPTDGKNLVELQIGGSGTYKASDYNAYGIAVARVTPKYGGGATSKAAEHDFTEKHTPSIKEGGKGRNFSAAMMKTNLQGGGTCLWIPKMDVVLKNKYISQSGTYTAKADDCFGFDQVTVSGVDVEITQDEDGDDVERTTDGGEVTETKLPSYIRVTVLPQKIDYTVGETIDYTGLMVHAYTKSGIDLGVVPFNELILPATKAGEGWADEWTDGHGLNAMQIAYTSHWSGYINWLGELVERQVFCSDRILGTDGFGYPATYGGNEPATLFMTRYNGNNYAARITGNTLMAEMYCKLNGESDNPWGYGDPHGFFKSGAGGGYVGDNAFARISWESMLTSLPESTVDPTTVDPATLYPSQGESIPVQWARPCDGQILEDRFEIIVTPSGGGDGFGGAGGGGGQTSGGGAGRDN